MKILYKQKAQGQDEELDWVLEVCAEELNVPTKKILFLSKVNYLIYGNS